VTLSKSLPTGDNETTGIIGRRLPRETARRHVRGAGRFVDDMSLPRMLHAAFLRSPVARGTISSIDLEPARQLPGVVGIFIHSDLAKICAPMDMPQSPGFRFPDEPQHVLAGDRVFWQGQAIAIVVAQSRAVAEDAVEAIGLHIDQHHAIANPEEAIAAGAELVHPDIATNIAMTLQLGPQEPSGRSNPMASIQFTFARHSAIPLETRGVIASYEGGTGGLTIWQSHQMPHQQRDIISRLLGIPEHKVRIVCPDVGGAFGVKLQSYPDELAAIAVSKVLEQPVKYVADRFESFTSDTHARDHRMSANIVVNPGGWVEAFEADNLVALGAYAGYPRGSAGEGVQSVNMIGLPYGIERLKARLRLIYQNKVPVGAIRGVGQPVATTITELLIDKAARAIGEDPVTFRQRNYHAEDSYPLTSAGGLPVERLSSRECLAKLCSLMDYDRLRAEQTTLRTQNKYRGIGVATFAEITAPGPQYYGPLGIRVTSQDGATIRFESSGTFTCVVAATDQGQGTEAGLAQIAAHVLGVSSSDVAIVAGDTAVTHYGGGAWASRGIAICGEATRQAASKLRDSILRHAAMLLQTSPDELTIAAGAVCETTGKQRLSLKELAHHAHFRHDIFPPGYAFELTASAQFTPSMAYFMANGVQGSHVEVDIETGIVTLLGHWVVEDCGTVINPMLVDEQIRGGVLHGIGAALYEDCAYDDNGQMLAATFADYMLPMASEMPDIHVGHVETKTGGSTLGAKGAGEAGAVGAPAAVLCAINDALSVFGTEIDAQPATPAVVMRALLRARCRTRST